MRMTSDEQRAFVATRLIECRVLCHAYQKQLRRINERIELTSKAGGFVTPQSVKAELDFTFRRGLQLLFPDDWRKLALTYPQLRQILLDLSENRSEIL